MIGVGSCSGRVCMVGIDLQYARGIAARQRICGYILRHDAARGDDAVVSDGDSLEHDAARAEPNVVADPDVRIMFRRREALAVFRRPGGMEIRVDKHAIGTNQGISADADGSRTRRYRTAAHAAAILENDSGGRHERSKTDRVSNGRSRRAPGRRHELDAIADDDFPVAASDDHATKDVELTSAFDLMKPALRAEPGDRSELRHRHEGM